MLNFWGVFPMQHSGSTSFHPKTPRHWMCAAFGNHKVASPGTTYVTVDGGPEISGEAIHQLIWRIDPIIYKVLPISCGWLFRISSINSMNTNESYNKINTTCHCTGCIDNTDFRVKVNFIFLLREGNNQCFFHGASKDDKRSEVKLYLPLFFWTTY